MTEKCEAQNPTRDDEGVDWCLVHKQENWECQKALLASKDWTIAEMRGLLQEWVDGWDRQVIGYNGITAPMTWITRVRESLNAESVLARKKEGNQ